MMTRSSTLSPTSLTGPGAEIAWDEIATIDSKAACHASCAQALKLASELSDQSDCRRLDWRQKAERIQTLARKLLRCTGEHGASNAGLLFVKTSTVKRVRDTSKACNRGSGSSAKSNASDAQYSVEARAISLHFLHTLATLKGNLAGLHIGSSSHTKTEGKSSRTGSMEDSAISSESESEKQKSLFSLYQHEE